MYFVSFIVVIVCAVIAAILFGRGLMRLYQGDGRARGLISSGFGIGLIGVIIGAIVFGFFSL